MIPQLEYAPYVWTCYGIFLAIVVWQFVQPILRRRRLLAEVREEATVHTEEHQRR